MSLFKNSDGSWNVKAVLGTVGITLSFILSIVAVTFRTDHISGIFDLVKLILGYVFAIVF